MPKYCLVFATFLTYWFIQYVNVIIHFIMRKYYHKLLYKYIRAEEVSFKLNLFHFLIVPVVLRNNWN